MADYSSVQRVPVTNHPVSSGQNPSLFWNPEVSLKTSIKESYIILLPFSFHEEVPQVGSLIN